MKLPWISRRAAAEQLARELQRRAAELQRQTAAIRTSADARVLAATQERDWLRARNEQLVDTIIAFKKDGFGVPTRGQIRQAPNLEAIALERAEGQLTREFVENAKADIMAKTGLNPADAEREARRLRDEAMSQHPAGG